MPEEEGVQDLIGEEEAQEESPQEGISTEENTQGEAPDDKEGLAERAKEYGISEEDLEAFGDKAPEMLDKFAEMYDARIADIGRGLLEKEQSAPPPENPEQEGEETSSVAERLEAAGYDDALIGIVQGLESQIAQLKESAIASQEASPDELAAELDGFFRNPPERFAAVIDEALGGKSILELQEGSAERKFVESVVSEIDALYAGYASQGKDMPLAVLGEKALAIACKDQIKALAEKELAGKIKKRGGSALTEPGGTATKPKEVNKEIGEVAEVMREFGMIPKGGLMDYLT